MNMTHHYVNPWLYPMWKNTTKTDHATLVILVQLISPYVLRTLSSLYLLEINKISNVIPCKVPAAQSQSQNMNWNSNSRIQKAVESLLQDRIKIVLSGTKILWVISFPIYSMESFLPGR